MDPSCAGSCKEAVASTVRARRRPDDTLQGGVAWKVRAGGDGSLLCWIMRKPIGSGWERQGEVHLAGGVIVELTSDYFALDDRSAIHLSHI
jgi:hypothetical protein